MSKSQLATLLSESGQPQFHPTTISRIEAGERSIRVAEAMHIANALGVRFEALLPVDGVASLVRSAQVQAQRIEGNIRRLRGEIDTILVDQYNLRDLIGRISPEDLREAEVSGYERGRLRAHLYGAKKAAEMDLVQTVKEVVEEWNEEFGDDDGVDQEA